LLKTEKQDRLLLNNYYKKLSHNYSLAYLQSVIQYPWWRLCFCASIMVALPILFFIILILNINIKYKNIIICCIFWFLLIILFLAFNKILTYWNWHYVIADGLIKKSLDYSK
jgi:hypothetical protein